MLKGTQIVIVESPRHLFAYFHVTDIYTCLISKFHKHIVDFTISAYVKSTKFMLIITSENKNFLNLNHTLKIFGPKFLRHIDIVRQDNLPFK